MSLSKNNIDLPHKKNVDLSRERREEELTSNNWQKQFQSKVYFFVHDPGQRLDDTLIVIDFKCIKVYWYPWQ
jgi:hypothetical protein